ncbi:MAG: Stp1/IreP family PP2C-type Ser/Thr phosphatase [Firmicutes bacterium]|nr:Stp1/IreP family PP2C-type Ser/Thr phosphatase [Bacillota bacterium]
MAQQIGFKCNRGVVRKNNEDACFVIPNKDVYIVADGVGGNNSGELASNTAVEKLANFVKENNIEECETPEEIFAFFTEAVDVANESIYRLGLKSLTNRGMATTIVMAYLYDGDAYITNIGDSRAYLYRDGHLKRITKDHTYVNELIDKGVITEGEAEHHKQKNVITKALGAEKGAEPDFYKVAIEGNDILLLCSDGLYGEVGEKKMASLMKHSNSMNDLTTRLVDEAIRAGGRDNITVICVRI